MHFTPGRIIALVALLVVFLIGLIIAFTAFATVERSTYAIKQAAWTGELSAHMKPGTFPLMFGSYEVWPVSETFDFTSPETRGGHARDVLDDSIEVRFNDGATCHISGTCRVEMPRTETEVIALVTQGGYRTYDQVEDKLILPVIRRALMMTANLMSSKESYSDRRADFFNQAWDQIENGTYQTKDEQVTELDPISGQEVKRVRKVLLKGPEGGILRDKSPLTGTGIRLSNFEIKNFVYEAKVQQQISTQQDAIMAVQTARANAEKAKQDALTAKANGETAVVKAKYEEEEKKIRAEVAAEQERAVATIAAQKLVDVAEKGKQTAAIELEIATLEKMRDIEKGTGQAEAKRLLLAADGALQPKLDAWTKAQGVWAEAFAKRAVPGVVMGGAGGQGTDMDAQTMMQFLGVQAARQLALDLEVKNTVPSEPLVPQVPAKPKAAK